MACSRVVQFLFLHEIPLNDMQYIVNVMHLLRPQDKVLR